MTPHPGDLKKMKEEKLQEAKRKQVEVENAETALQVAENEENSHFTDENTALLDSEQVHVEISPMIIAEKSQNEAQKEEEDLVPLIEDELDETESNDEHMHRNSVKFLPGSPNEPTEQRLKLVFN